MISITIQNIVSGILFDYVKGLDKHATNLIKHNNDMFGEASDMAEMLPLILYDIPTKTAGKGFSPNSAKTRFVLGYKNLPFETAWVEFPDVGPRLSEIGAPTNTRPNGELGYTVPVLSDPNTGALVTDSWLIAEYLDKTYPQKPVFPNGSRGLISAFEVALSSLAAPATGFNLLRASQVLSHRSLEFFVRTRPAPFGPQVDEWSPEGLKREAQWEAVEKYYENAKTWYERTEGKWVMGDTFSYADIIFAARSFWLKTVYKNEEWERIALLHGGKWEKFLADAEKECNLA